MAADQVRRERGEGTLNGGSKGNSFIRIDRFAEFLVAKKFGEHLLNLGNASGASHQNNVRHVFAGAFGILDHVLDGGQTLLEEGGAELFKFGSSDGGVEVFAIGQRFDVDDSGGATAQRSLGLLAGSLESPQSTCISSDIGLKRVRRTARGGTFDFFLNSLIMWLQMRLSKSCPPR